MQCETKPSQGGLRVSNELLAVDFSHLQFEFINHFHNTSHLVEIAVDLVVQALFIFILVCFIDTELLVLTVLKHGCYIVIWVVHNMEHMNVATVFCKSCRAK